MVTERGLGGETWICDGENEDETYDRTQTENTGRFHGECERNKIERQQVSTKHTKHEISELM